MHKWQNIQQETTYILLLYWFFRTVSNSKQAIVAVIAKLLHMTSLSIKQRKKSTIILDKTIHHWISHLGFKLTIINFNPICEASNLML